MRLKRSFSKRVTFISTVSVLIILLGSFFMLSYYLINVEDRAFYQRALEKTGLVNLYCNSKVENKDIVRHIKSFSNGLITYENLKKYIELSNHNSYKMIGSISYNGEAYYPLLPHYIKNVLRENSTGGHIKNRVIIYEGNISVLNTTTVNDVELVTIYHLSRDPILKNNIKATGVEGFQFGDRYDNIGWILSRKSVYEADSVGLSDYHFGISPRNVLIKNTIGLEGLYFIVSDKEMVDRNNRIICYIGTVCLIIIILILTLTFLLRKKLIKYLGQVVTDTRILANKGSSYAVRGKNYKYREFQSLINAFLTVLDARDKIEEKLVESKDKMEDVVLQRTRELTEAVERAEEANRSKMNFLASVSHEIRTPMNCIIGFCELIINDRDEADPSGYAKRIINESETLLHLINDILDHSKIESGKMKLQVNRVNIEGFIKNILSLGNPYNQNSSIYINYKLENVIPAYVGIDEVKLYQVLTNLYFNALKYTSSGSVSVSVSYKVSDRQGYLFISVKDTGIGIPENRISTVFDSYEQLDDGLTKGFRGTGLGLTITKKVVELMKGEISATSEVGVGSCFTVKLPVEKVQQDRPKKIEAPINSNFNDFFGKILIVEDYPTNRIVARKHLETAGHRVYEVENGKEAVERCYKEKFDLILMDIQMPVMDGFSATIKIRSEDGVNSKTPIIAMTANGLQSIKKQCYEAGMNSIILKPIRRDSFLNSVRKGLKGDVLV